MLCQAVVRGAVCKAGADHGMSRAVWYSTDAKKTNMMKKAAQGCAAFVLHSDRFGISIQTDSRFPFRQIRDFHSDRFRDLIQTDFCFFSRRRYCIIIETGEGV